MNRLIKNNRGFTLAEVVITVIIIGILSAVAMRSVITISETSKVEATKNELNSLAFAIVGNPKLENNGTRSDFGYVGDVGAMPTNLDALYTNPGGYATWNGPYIKRRFTQITNDYKEDAWGVAYSYSGVSISSSGSGSSIVKQTANSTDDILLNKVSGNIYDSDNTPPGNIYKDSINVRLTIPNGAGSYATKTTQPDGGGYFRFDSIPIGNHDIEIIYNPSYDTLRRFASVSPNSSIYGEYNLPSNYWYASGSGIIIVPASDTLENSALYNNLYYWIENTTSADIVITSMTLSWSSSTAYYHKFDWNGIEVYKGSGTGQGSGDVTIFSTPQIFYAGTQIKLSTQLFKTNPGSGSPVDMSGTDFIVTLSDGSTFNFTVN